MSKIDAGVLHQLMAYEAKRTAVPVGFPEFPPINPQRYTSESFAELERQHVFGRSWLLAGHLDEIPEPGCFQRWDHAGKPVVLVHTEEGEIRALLNRCSHRGAPIVQPANGPTQGFDLQLSWLDLQSSWRSYRRLKRTGFSRPQ